MVISCRPAAFSRVCAGFSTAGLRFRRQPAARLTPPPRLQSWSTAPWSANCQCYSVTLHYNSWVAGCGKFGLGWLGWPLSEWERHRHRPFNSPRSPSSTKSDPTCACSGRRRSRPGTLQGTLPIVTDQLPPSPWCRAPNSSAAPAERSATCCSIQARHHRFELFAGSSSRPIIRGLDRQPRRASSRQWRQRRRRLRPGRGPFRAGRSVGDPARSR